MTRKAVFLDRDGTINREVHHLRSLDQLRVLSGVASAIRTLNERGFLVIVVTNQAVVGRGWLRAKEVDGIHQILRKRLRRQGARIDAIYYCPHHPVAASRPYRRDCRCRKPRTGMITRAIREFEIDSTRSFMVGDTTRDVLCGARARLRTILVKTGYGGSDAAYDVEPDYVVENLPAALRIICANR